MSIAQPCSKNPLISTQVCCYKESILLARPGQPQLQANEKEPTQ